MVCTAIRMPCTPGSVGDRTGACSARGYELGFTWVYDVIPKQLCDSLRLRSLNWRTPGEITYVLCCSSNFCNKPDPKSDLESVVVSQTVSVTRVSAPTPVAAAAAGGGPMQRSPPRGRRLALAGASLHG
jgi:hypothetical protein